MTSEETPGPIPVNTGPSADTNNESTYCICGQVSFGEMIACDDDDVFSREFRFKLNHLLLV